MKRYSKDPYQTTAIINCYCAETGKAIKTGEPIIYYPATKKVYCMDSQTAQDFATWKFDTDVLGANY